MSQPITISGTVTDASGKAITGATVQLEKTHTPITTGTDGGFSLTSGVGISTGAGLIKKANDIHVNFTGASLPVTLSNRSTVFLEIFNVNGRNILNYRSILDAGDHLLSIPQLSTGIYLFKLTLGTWRYTIRCVSLKGGRLQSNALQVTGHPAITSSILEDTATTTDDVLVVTKNGLLTHRIAIRKPVIHDIKIRMLPDEDDCTDIDGNVYQSVRIGNQVWTVENLKTTRYNDGTAINYVPDSASWLNIYLSGATTAAYCVYKGTAANEAKYGVFYNWYAVGTGKLAPEGWRVPTDADWDTLQSYLIAHNYNYDGTTTDNLIAKSMAAQWDWDSSELEGAIGNEIFKNNTSGFSAIPGGLRHWGGSYYSLFSERIIAYLWSSTELDSSNAWHRYLDCHRNYLERTTHHKNTGFPVRIVRDVK